MRRGSVRQAPHVQDMNREGVPGRDDRRVGSAGPPTLLDESGKVFYSGRVAFASPAQPMYLLGLNPGGKPERHEEATIRWDLTEGPGVHTDYFSAYTGDRQGERTRWQRGPHPLQRRGQYVCRQLGVEPDTIPASNLIFMRSPSRRALREHGGLDALVHRCWPFHQRVIEALGIRVVICFQGDAATWICKRFPGMHQTAGWREQNQRRWTSRVYRSHATGLTLIRLPHPSVTKWDAPPSDSTALVQDVLASHGIKDEPRWSRSVDQSQR